MNRKFVGAGFGALLLSGVAVATIAATTTAAFAAEAPKPKGTKAVGLALQAAMTALQAKDTATAQTQLAAAKAVPDPTEFDVIEIEIVNAALQLTLNNHPALLASYKIIAASPQFTVAESPAEQVLTLKNMMALQSEAKDYAGAIQTGERLAASGQMDDKAAANLATAYYFNKDYKKAQSLSQKSVDAALAANQKPAQGPLQIIFNSYADQNDQTNARKSLEMMLIYYPEPKSWGKLVDNSLVKGLTDMQLLQLYRLRVLSGATGDATDYTIGSDVAMKNGYPGDARSMLQTATSRGVSGVSEKLATAKAKAANDEKTLAANDTAAAKSGTGQLDTFVSEQFYGYGRFTEAETAAKRAVSKGGVKDPEEPKMLVGMSQAAAGKYSDALASFKLVGGSENQKRVAELWITYCQSKLQPAAPAN